MLIFLIIQRGHDDWESFIPILCGGEAHQFTRFKNKFSQISLLRLLSSFGCHIQNSFILFDLEELLCHFLVAFLLQTKSKKIVHSSDFSWSCNFPSCLIIFSSFFPRSLSWSRVIWVGYSEWSLSDNTSMAVPYIFWSYLNSVLSEICSPLSLQSQGVAFS